jgi:hypothetical protein
MLIPSAKIDFWMMECRYYLDSQHGKRDCVLQSTKKNYAVTGSSGKPTRQTKGRKRPLSLLPGAFEEYKYLKYIPL